MRSIARSLAIALLVVIPGLVIRVPPRALDAAGACGPNPSPVNPGDPSIIVTSPTDGATVLSPLFISGKARVFEAVVSLALKDAGGATLVAGTAMAQEGAPSLAPFATSLSFTVSTSTPACLWVFEASARDGRPINVVQVPLTLLPAGSAVATYMAGWNQVAGPAGMVFTQAVGPLYSFQAGDTAYEMLPNTTGVVGGRGYWAYFTAAGSLPLTGAGASSATITAPVGQWVMVGNPSPSTTATVRGADAVLRYDPGSGAYVPLTTLAPGQGAWAYSSRGGSVTVGP